MVHRFIPLPGGAQKEQREGVKRSIWRKRSIWAVFFDSREKQRRTRHQRQSRCIEYIDLKRGESGDWDEPKQILLAQVPAAGRGVDRDRRRDHCRLCTGVGMGGLVRRGACLLRDFLPAALIGGRGFRAFTLHFCAQVDLQPIPAQKITVHKKLPNRRLFGWKQRAIIIVNADIITCASYKDATSGSGSS